MISEEDVEKALDWLRDNAKEIGAAKEDAVRTEKMVSHHKALAMKMSCETSVGAQEREALSSEEYVLAIDRMAKAAGYYEELRALREAAALKLNSYQTMSANFRAMKL